jgi:hypothetical protein
VYLKILGCVAVVKEVTAVSVDDEFTIFDAKGTRIFTDFPIVQVLAIE